MARQKITPDPTCLLEAHEVTMKFTRYDVGVNSLKELVVRAFRRDLKREKFTARHLLQCSCVENIIGSRHCAAAALEAPDIADIKFDLVCHVRVFCLIFVTHVVLLLFVT